MGDARTASELRAMVQAELNALPEVMAIKSRMPLAGPIAWSVVPTPVDRLGRNWDMTQLRQGAGYADEFHSIVEALRLRFVLMSDPCEHVVRDIAMP